MGLSCKSCSIRKEKYITALILKCRMFYYWFSYIMPIIYFIFFCPVWFFYHARTNFTQPMKGIFYFFVFFFFPSFQILYILLPSSLRRDGCCGEVFLFIKKVRGKKSVFWVPFLFPTSSESVICSCYEISSLFKKLLPLVSRLTLFLPFLCLNSDLIKKTVDHS